MENFRPTPTIGPAVGDAVSLKPLHHANGREYLRFVGKHGTFLGVADNGMAYVQFEGHPWPYPCLLEQLEGYPNPSALDVQVLLDVEMRRLGLRWRGPRMRAWMQALSDRLGYPVVGISDIPLPAMVALLRKLQAEPSQLDLLGGEGA